MEAQEETIMETRETTHQIIKGKRTKRPRPLSPLALTMAAASSSSSSVASPTTSAGFEMNTDEEEDMANCLILLAQGQHDHHHHHRGRKTLEPLATAAANNVHQCKTCNRSFASFQALGGHRASHKKPKANNNVDDKKMLSFVKEEQRDLHDQFLNNTTLSLQVSNRGLSSSGNNNKSKVHECSICGAEFSSGQALGGHMRRHRTLTSAPTTTTTATTATNLSVGKARNILELDLNLPAPEDDRRETKFPFAAKEQVIVFSTSPLVDCHY
ncbi:hypothetical protein UlMin_005751 [Ulmus minor]